MNNNPIGIFDSGVGGLTVLKELLEVLPNEKYLYFGDTQRVPYGEKTNEQILAYSKQILDWFQSKNVKAVVMACNTSCAISLEQVQNDYDFKIYGLIDPISKYLSTSNHQKIGVIATNGTIRNKAYSTTINKHNTGIKVLETPTPGLVEIVEEQRINDYNTYKVLYNYIDNFIQEDVDKIILGCTHYPYFKEIIDDICKKDITLDPAKFLAQEVNSSLSKSTENGFIKFHASSNIQNFKTCGNALLPIIKDVQLMSFE